MCDKLFVVTGGPGSGKSSLIDKLASHGFRTKLEAGRAIIKDQVRIGGAALPWADKALFAELMLCWELRSYMEASADASVTILDRGIPDVVGYLTLYGIPVPEYLERAAALHPYNRTVFLAPYWDQIFTNDDERKQGVDEAKATGDMMYETYTRLGYEIVELPLIDIDARADFVRDYIGRRQFEN